MTLRESVQYGSPHQENTLPLEDRAATEPSLRATLFHYDPISGQDVSYEFSIDASLAEPGVPEWVTHYHLFPDPVQRALAGLYEEHIDRSENSLRERS